MEKYNSIVISAVHKNHHSIFDAYLFKDVVVPCCPSIGDLICVIEDLKTERKYYRVSDREFIFVGIDKNFEYILLYLDDENFN